MLIRRIFPQITKRNADLRWFASGQVYNQSTVDNYANSPDSDLHEKLLKVAIVGSPNSGKSTLINALMDRKVCAASCKVHTTRTKARAVFTEGDAQIVFIDTPGLVHYKEVNKYKLDKSFLRDTRATFLEADIIGVVHDVSNSHTRDNLDLKVINLLEGHPKKPSFLVLNKIDLLKSKRKLLDITRVVTEGRLKGVLMPNAMPNETKDIRGWTNFSEIFMISALTTNGLDDMRSYLVGQAKPAHWLFPENVWSDQTPERIIINTVKAQLLNYLQQELPYQCQPQMEFFETNEHGAIKSVVLIKCPTDRIAKLIAGGSNGRLRQITENVQRDLQSAFQNFVMINLVLQGPEGAI